MYCPFLLVPCLLPYLYTALSHWFHICVGLSHYCPFPLVTCLCWPISIMPFPVGSTSVLEYVLSLPCLLEDVYVAPSLYCLPCWLHVCFPLYTALSHWFHISVETCLCLPLYCPFPLVPCLLELSVLPHLCTALSCWLHDCCPVSILPFPIGSTSVLACLITAPSHWLHVCVAPSLYCPFPLVPHLCWNLSVLSLQRLLEHVCVAPSLCCPFMLVTC